VGRQCARENVSGLKGCLSGSRKMLHRRDSIAEGASGEKGNTVSVTAN
jgi:hypothetical protein